MALLNVHPDYIGFDRQRTKGSEYDAAHYQDFLEYVAKNYAGGYWHALPREIAGWYKEQCLPQLDAAGPEKFSVTTGTRPLTGKRAAVVLYSYYASDPRPRRETEALGQAGMEVDVICLRQDAREPRHEVLRTQHVAQPVGDGA